MNALLNIPAHTRCKQCGECCGPVAATTEEIKAIFKYMEKFTEAEDDAIRKNRHDLLTCVFLNRETKRCMIYPVRPLICRMFGVMRGMNCKYGNTHNLDGLDYFQEYMINNDMAFFMDVNWETGHVFQHQADKNAHIRVLPTNVSGAISLGFAVEEGEKK